MNRRDLEASSLASWSRALDDQRRELLAGVGHELKTPLSIVLGLCARLIAADELGEEPTADVRRIRANAYVLLKRVEELLQVSRLDGGHLDLEPRDVDVARLVRSSCEGFASVAELRDQTLVLESPPELPARLVRASCEGFASVAELRRQRLVVEAPDELGAHVDEEKLLSVVSNLLANALKYAPAGGTVRCTVAGAGERMRIEVADSGPGVEDGLRETIFERYRRGAGSATRPGGTGLGLAIVRDLVTLHNGTVTLTDAPEGGALFVVDLPVNVDGGADSQAARTLPTIDVAERQRATVERLHAELDADGRRGAPAVAGEPGTDRASILVVTRDSELGAYVGELIGLRYDVVHAIDALEAARLIADGHPDAVVLDAAAGSSAITALRRRLGEVPLLTLAASPDDVPGLLLAGAHDSVVKPFGADELKVRLDALVARGRVYARRETALAGLDRAFHVAPSAMALISPEGRIVRVNHALCTLLGFGANELIGRTVQDLTHPADLATEEERRRLVLERRIVVDRGTWRLARGDGSYLRVGASASLVDGTDGAEACLLWHLTDAPEDLRGTGGGVLAGPPGQRAFERAVRHQLLRCRRYGEQAALVRCSLHGLAEVRSSHGPETADKLVAGILDGVRRRLRGTDVVAYVGDHEIAALLAHADMDAAKTTADAIRDAAQDLRVETSRGPVGTDASVGVASLVGAGSPGRAFADAGLAMNTRPGTPHAGRFVRRRAGVRFG